MPTTMFAVVRTDGYGKPQCVTVPWVTALLDQQESPQRYFVLPDEPLPAPRTGGAPKHVAKQRSFRNIGEALEE